MSDDFLDVAVGIGDGLVDDALVADGRCLWLGDALEQIDGRWQVVYRSFAGDLYSGTSGTAWFLAQLASRTGDRRYGDAAAGGLAHALDWAEGPAQRLAPSLYNGSLGPALIGTRVGGMLDDAELVRRARRIGEAELDRAIGVADRESDLLAGLAGAVVAAVALHDTTGDPAMLEQGARLADVLVERARPMFVGRAWGSPHGDATKEAPLCGLGHGASGVALALDELATRTGATRWADASHEAVRYERSLFDRGEQNWADLREFHRADLAAGQRPAFPVYWCHGAVGIGLARFRRWELVGDLAALAEAAAATQCALSDVATRTASYERDYGHNFSLCHGFAGTVELLLCAAAHGDARGRDAAVRIGRFGREHCVGSPAGWPCGVRDGGETPGLMLGLAGIGSCYLRLADDRAVSPAWWLAAGAPDPLPRVNPVSDARQPRVIVQLATSAGEPTGAAVSLLERVPGGRVIRVSPRGRAIVELPPGADAVAVAAELQADPRVVYAEPDVIDTALPTNG